MKCSGWSSRGIWACSAALLGALAVAPAAGAHVTMSPARIDPGSEARLVFTVPDEEKVPITRVAIGLPPDFRLGQAEVAQGWSIETSPRTVSWSGSEIAPGRLVQFALTVDAPKTTERAVFQALVSLKDGQTLTYKPSLMVETAPQPHDAGARTLATAALIVGGVGVAFGLAGSFLALWLWLRPRPPDLY